MYQCYQCDEYREVYHIILYKVCVFFHTPQFIPTYIGKVIDLYLFGYLHLFIYLDF